MEVEITGTHEERIEWIKQSPNIVTGNHRGVHFLYNSEQPLFFSEDPKKFPDLSEFHKLGLLFEAYLFGMCADNTLKYYRQQIVEHGQTLGEADFIFDNGKEPAHVEVAIKFYMQFLHGGRPLFYGPNANDQLELKFQKLTDHQCWLLEDGRYQLLSLTQSPGKFGLVKGFLFHQPNEKPQPPPYISNDTNWGWWIHQQDIATLTNSADDFQPLHKFDWMLNNYSNPRPLSDIGQYLSDTTPLMINIGTKNRYVRKVMVVPNDWPKRP